jgi:hypothetical protein
MLLISVIILLARWSMARVPVLSPHFRLAFLTHRSLFMSHCRWSCQEQQPRLIVAYSMFSVKSHQRNRISGIRLIIGVQAMGGAYMRPFCI